MDSFECCLSSFLVVVSVLLALVEVRDSEIMDLIRSQQQYELVNCLKYIPVVVNELLTLDLKIRLAIYFVIT
jgi:hypothetical protein